LTLYDADCGPGVGPYFLIEYAYGLPYASKSPPWTYSVEKGYRVGGDWTLVGLGGGPGYDIAAGADDSVHAAVYYGGYLRFDQDSVWPGAVTDASIQVDSEGRKQIAFVTPDSVLRFAYKDTRWHFREVTGVTSATCCDLALAEDGQPLIAYEDSSGVSLARGVDVLGVGENSRPRASSRKLAATVIRSLPAGVVAFDATGRRVLNPKSGVFFVQERSAASGEPSAATVRKVVISR
jgi:hypothetical protein